MTSAKTHCLRGHELTEGNVRARTGARAGHRECLICYRASSAARGRRTRAATDQSLANRRRLVRTRTKRMDLRLVQNGTTLTLHLGADQVVVSGDLVASRPGSPSGRSTGHQDRSRSTYRRGGRRGSTFTRPSRKPPGAPPGPSGRGSPCWSRSPDRARSSTR